MVSRQYNTFQHKNNNNNTHDLLYNTSPASQNSYLSDISNNHNNNNVVTHHHNKLNNVLEDNNNTKPRGLYFNDNIYIAPHIFMCLFTIIITILCILLYMYAIQHIDVVCIVFTTLCILTLLHTSLVNPGIVTQQLSHNSMSYEQQQTVIYNVLNSIETHPSIEPQYCQFCNLIRPARARHCKHCNVCIVNFDHCCLFSGSNIGKYNYKYYLLYLLSLTILSAYIAIQCSIIVFEQYSKLYNIYHDKHDTLYHTVTEIIELTLYDQSIAFALMILSLFIFIVIFTLLLYHIKQIWQGTTTNEDIRKVFANVDNPHAKGIEYLKQIFLSNSSKSNVQADDNDYRAVNNV